MEGELQEFKFTEGFLSEYGAALEAFAKAVTRACEEGDAEAFHQLAGGAVFILQARWLNFVAEVKMRDKPN